MIVTAAKYGLQRMINRRLITFGCSFTKYNWPTWADILGKEYLLFHNWAYTGIGNRAIAERLAEAHTVHDFNENDTIIIQWSSHSRHDYARPDLIDDLHIMWRTKGNIFSPWNEEIFDEKWIRNFWNEKAYYIHTLNSILLAQQFLESIGCQWYMTSMSDLYHIQNLDFEYKESDPDYPTFDVWANSPDLLPYREKIWDKHTDKWLPHLLAEKNSTPELDWWFKDDENRDNEIFSHKQGRFREPHLTYRQYYNYLKNNNVHEILGIEDTQEKITSEELDFYDQLVRDSETHRDFLKAVSETMWGMTSRAMGR